MPAGFRLDPGAFIFYNRFATATLVDKSRKSPRFTSIRWRCPPAGTPGCSPPILSGVYDLCQEISQGQFALSGEANLLSYKEFQPIAYEVLEFLGDWENVPSLVQKAQGRTTVTIGRENSHPVLYDSAVVVTRYRIAGGATGAVGLIGPVRQNYAKMIPYLEYFSDRLRAPSWRRPMMNNNNPKRGKSTGMTKKQDPQVEDTELPQVEEAESKPQEAAEEPTALEQLEEEYRQLTTAT